MKIMTVDEFQAQFTELIEQVKKGVEIDVIPGINKQVVSYFTPTV